MCGICGYTGPEIPGRLQTMADFIRHRGPDGDGFYHDPERCVNLGHRRLSIIDLVTGDQPMSNEDGTVWTVFNGEIYNFKELRRKLKQAGHRLATTSDTETILHLYEDKGFDLLGELNGMFAFALWDAKRRRLFLARDRFGVKPVYWSVAQDRFIFGSELKSLLCWPGEKREIDPQSLSLYLSLRNVPEPNTIYQGIHALPPAHYLIWEPGREIKIERYWNLDFTPGPWNGEDEMAEAIEEILIDATRLRMRSDVPVGAYLSGGVDSSLVVALVRSLNHDNLNTFCLGYSDSIGDKLDIHYSRKLSRLFETQHHECIMSAEDLVSDLPSIIRHLEQPFAGVISTYFLTRLVSRHVKVVLTGDGAGDQMASYGHHRLVWPA